ncbi:MAG: hypothetical protein U9N73_02675 [Candidatus Auribacterota bacterium]|nr:hypothetical protein [Candidatus Auribacterota bacterium]
MIEERVIYILREGGPMTGEQLLRQTGAEVFRLWQTCRNSDKVVERNVGRRFLRLDQAVKDYARLSPSIRREFQTYTVLGLKEQLPGIEDCALDLMREIRKISQTKFNLVSHVVSSIVSSLGDRELIRKKTCFILAGDITYEMAHSVPRPEKSTGKLVRGSDLDLVVITDDTFPEDVLIALDEAIHTRKYYLLTHPSYQEEIDYIIKPLARIEEQLRFDTFGAMVACKILREGVFLHGSVSLFQTVKSLLEKNNIPEKLELLEESARSYRRRAEECLQNLTSPPGESEYSKLFFTREERLEDTFDSA